MIKESNGDMADITKFPKVEDYVTLEEYSKVVKEYYGVTNVNDIDIYHTWTDILQRCYNVNNGSYHRYGGRGITVCDRWRESFLYFISDMGPKPSDEKYKSGYPIYTLDRIDNDGSYEPGNCRWVTVSEQVNNRSVETKFYIYKYKLYSAGQLAKMFDMNVTTLRRLLDNGMTVEEAINTPIRKNDLFDYKGKSCTKTKLSEIAGISRHTITRRLDEGMFLEEAMSAPVREVITATFQGVKRDLLTWKNVLGTTSVSSSMMRRRYNKGLRGVEVIRPSTKRSRVNGKLPQVISTLNGKITVYHNIFHCAEVTNIIIDNVVSELNKENGYIMYMEDHAKKIV